VPEFPAKEVYGPEPVECSDWPVTTMQPSASIPSLNARELQALVAIAHSGSLIGAAAYLQTSQSALSRTVTRIEKLVGVRLFSRTTRRIELTPAGREFVAVSERVLNDLRIALSGLRDVAAEQRGQVIVSTLSIVVHHTLPRLVRSFREQRPLVDIQLRAGHSSTVIDDVVGGVADFGIISGEMVSSVIERVHLRRESLYALIPRDHPLADTNAPIRLAQLRDIPLVSPPRDSQTRLLVEGAAAAASVHLRHSVLVPGFPEIIEYVRAGVGVGLVPAGALPQPLPEGVVGRLLSAPALAISVSMIRLIGRHMSPAAEAFWGLVLKDVKSHQTWQVARADVRRAGRSSDSGQPRPIRSPPRSRASVPRRRSAT
jgi:DNA-binding transcriptional LysR family regulator